jgi:ATP-dependent exoDNAse (exonuclease V) alpha subunit
LGVIENRVAELQSVDGIGPKRRQRIEQAWKEAKHIREIMLFLHSHGVSTSRAVRIFKTYGEQAIEKVRSNPYMLAKDIYGIGFATADQIAQKIGIPRDSLDRARAGIDHVLLEATSDGHCALPLEKLKLTAVKLLEIPEATIEQALSHMLTSGSLLLEEIDGDALIFLPHLRKAEEGIAAKIKALAQAPMIYPVWSRNSSSLPRNGSFPERRLMPLPAHSTSAGHPVVPCNAQFRCPRSSLDPAMRTAAGSACPGDCAPRGNVSHIAAGLGAAAPPRTR